MHHRNSCVRLDRGSIMRSSEQHLMHLITGNTPPGVFQEQQQCPAGTGPGSLVPCTSPAQEHIQTLIPAKKLIHLEGKASAWHDSYSHPKWRTKTPLMGAESFPVWTTGLKLEQSTLKQGSQASPRLCQAFLNVKKFKKRAIYIPN